MPEPVQSPEDPVDSSRDDPSSPDDAVPKQRNSPPQSMGEDQSGSDSTPSSGLPGGSLPTEPEREQQPGTVSTVWSSILSTAYRHLRQGR